MAAKLFERPQAAARPGDLTQVSLELTLLLYTLCLTPCAMRARLTLLRGGEMPEAECARRGVPPGCSSLLMSFLPFTLRNCARPRCLSPFKLSLCVTRKQRRISCGCHLAC